MVSEQEMGQSQTGPLEQAEPSIRFLDGCWEVRWRGFVRKHAQQWQAEVFWHQMVLSNPKPHAVCQL
jgi:hypothetical protein